MIHGYQSWKQYSCYKFLEMGYHIGYNCEVIYDNFSKKYSCLFYVSSYYRQPAGPASSVRWHAQSWGSSKSNNHYFLWMNISVKKCGHRHSKDKRNMELRNKLMLDIQEGKTSLISFQQAVGGSLSRSERVCQEIDEDEEPLLLSGIRSSVIIVPTLEEIRVPPSLSPSSFQPQFLVPAGDVLIRLCAATISRQLSGTTTEQRMKCIADTVGVKIVRKTFSCFSFSSLV